MGSGKRSLVSLMSDEQRLLRFGLGESRLSRLEESVVSAVVVRCGDGFAGVVVDRDHLHRGGLLEIRAAGVPVVLHGLGSEEVGRV